MNPARIVAREKVHCDHLFHVLPDATQITDPTHQSKLSEADELAFGCWREMKLLGRVGDGKDLRQGRFAAAREALAIAHSTEDLSLLGQNAERYQLEAADPGNCPESAEFLLGRAQVAQKMCDLFDASSSASE